MTPSKRSRLLELAERCEKARGPSLEIDVEIARLQGVTVWLRNAANTVNEETTYWRYTENVDAALTLVPKGWSIKAQLFDGHPVLGHTFDVGTHKGFHPTVPALALCSAALKALASFED